MSGVDPNETINTAREASQYWAALRDLWPIAFVGGCVGVIMHAREIYSRRGCWNKCLLVCLEWTTGAAAAMTMALLLPLAIFAFPGSEPYVTDIRAELGLCGFIGGSMGMGIFRWVARKFFHYDMDLRYKGQGEDSPG